MAPSAIGIVHDVVAVEYAARFMSAQLHRYPFRNARAHHVSNGSAAEIMNNDPAEPHLFARRLPSLSKIADRLPIIVEHVRTIGPTLLVCSLNYFQEFPA